MMRWLGLVYFLSLFNEVSILTIPPSVSVPVSCHQDQGVDAHRGRGEDQELVHLEQGIKRVHKADLDTIYLNRKWHILKWRSLRGPNKGLKERLTGRSINLWSAYLQKEQQEACATLCKGCFAPL